MKANKTIEADVLRFLIGIALRIGHSIWMAAGAR